MTEFAELKKSILSLKREMEKKSTLILDKIKLSLLYFSLEIIVLFVRLFVLVTEIIRIHYDFAVMITVIMFSKATEMTVSNNLLENTLIGKRISENNNSIDKRDISSCARYKHDGTNQKSISLSRAYSFAKACYSVIDQGRQHCEMIGRPNEIFVSDLINLESEVLLEWASLLKIPQVNFEKQLDVSLVISNRILSKESEMSGYLRKLSSTSPIRLQQRLSKRAATPILALQTASGRQGPDFRHLQDSENKVQPYQQDQTTTPQEIFALDVRSSQRGSLENQTKTTVIIRNTFEVLGDKNKYADWKYFVQFFYIYIIFICCFDRSRFYRSSHAISNISECPETFIVSRNQSVLTKTTSDTNTRDHYRLLSISNSMQKVDIKVNKIMSRILKVNWLSNPGLYATLVNFETAKAFYTNKYSTKMEISTISIDQERILQSKYYSLWLVTADNYINEVLAYGINKISIKVTQIDFRPLTKLFPINPLEVKLLSETEQQGCQLMLQVRSAELLFYLAGVSDPSNLHSHAVFSVNNLHTKSMVDLNPDSRSGCVIPHKVQYQDTSIYEDLACVRTNVPDSC